MSSASIVIPCYNLGEFVGEAVESALRQTHRADDIIVVDDGSTDPKTVDVLNRLRSEEVQVLRIPNQGVSAARNHGIVNSKGEFILCLDADDVLNPDYLQETIPILEAKPQVGIIATWVEFFGAQTGIWRPPAFDFVRMLWHDTIPSASMFRRACWHEVGGYVPFDPYEDWKFFLDITMKGWQVAVVEKVLYRYRKRKGSRLEMEVENRASLFRQLIDFHPEVYQHRHRDILMDMDTEYRVLRYRWKELEKRDLEQTETIRVLRQSLEAKEKPMNQPKSDKAPANPVPPPNAPPVSGEAGESKRVAELEKQVEKLQAEVSRRDQAERIKKIVRACIPPQARVLVVSKGDADLVDLEGRQGLHFPQTEEGAYSGYHPGSSDEAIAHLEELRTRGAEFLLFPGTAFWWLKHYTRFKEHLEQRYAELSNDDACVIYRLKPRSKPLQHTFSVVICTYKRAAYLGKAIESLFNQDYPKDKYEIIIVNNDSPDNTEEIAKHYLRRSPVPFSYHVEKENGLSYARNLGITKARHDYIAYLDDDAAACPGWLAAFNEVINDHKALVVGGRVDIAHEEGFVPPDWFNYPYPKAFFEINWRDRGKKEPVFKIAQHYYLGGGNSAYARKLFQYFGGYSANLGRDGKTLLAGEETYLNMLMAKEGIPLFYSEKALIYHFIESTRVTKEHIKRKAYWSGITNAIIHTLYFDAKERREKAEASLKEMKWLLKLMRTNPGDPQNYWRGARAAYHLAYLRKLHQLRLKKLLGVHKYVPQQVAWKPQGWIEELRRLPKTTENLQRLYDLYVALGKESRARVVHRKLLKRLAMDEADAGDANANGVSSGEQYRKLVERVRQTVAANLPAGAKVIVASKGDSNLVNLTDRQGWHFPQVAGGEYTACYPKNSTEAITQLENLRLRGAEYFLLPKTALWWLEHYAGFKEHLDKTCRLAIREEDTCFIFALNGAHGELNGAAKKASAGV